MEQMILQYVKAHGQVNKQAVVDLCRVDQNRAAYLLKKLVKSGELQRTGLGRAAAYRALNSEKSSKELGKTRKSAE